MNLFINGVPRDLDRLKQQLYARAAHFFKHLFADYAYDEKMPTMILRFMEDNREQQQTGVRLH